tara:strand:+ start:594 stop:1358 length:765 start_codon:yes stop_codon:yes gene_type:complete
VTKKIPGFILLSRDMLEKENIWAASPDLLKLWIYFLLRCNFGKKSYVYSGVEVKRGQFLRSYRAIAEDNSYTERSKRITWTPGKVKRMIQTLVNDGRITIVDHGVENVGTLIEVVNYDKRQKIESYRSDAAAAPKESHRGSDQSSVLWDLWLKNLSPKAPHPSLTQKRRQVLNALYNECLTKNGGDPLEIFRNMLNCLKASEHHMSVRSYQYPESFLRSPERRESWYLRAVQKTQKDSQSQVGLSLQEIRGAND